MEGGGGEESTLTFFGSHVIQISIRFPIPVSKKV